MNILGKQSQYEPDRRSHHRFAIGGSLSFDTPGMRSKGEPVDMSLGGILFHAARPLEAGATGTLQLNVDGFTEMIIATVRIVRTEKGLVAANFVVPSVELVRCINWLAAKDLPDDAGKAR